MPKESHLLARILDDRMLLHDGIVLFVLALFAHVLRQCAFIVCFALLD
jgi:hypothetical protein